MARAPVYPELVDVVKTPTRLDDLTIVPVVAQVLAGANTIVVLELHNGSADASMQLVEQPVLQARDKHSIATRPQAQSTCPAGTPGDRAHTRV